MIYKVEITDTASKDLENIYNYINQYSDSENSAKNKLINLLDKINSLSQFPERYPTAELTDRVFNNARKMSADGYVIIYDVDKNRNNVTVLRIINAKLDYLSITIEEI